MKVEISLELQDGDVIVTQTNIPGVQHFGVVILEGQRIDVLHLRPFENVKREPITTFLAERRFIEYRRTGAAREYILERFKELQNLEYDLNDFNCIHYTEYLTGIDY